MSTAMNGPLTGQRAVVTGASRGIGKAVALALAAAGCDLAICARTRSPEAGVPGSLQETAAAIEAIGRRALSIEADLAQPPDVEALFRESVSRLGPIDILVNNAALQIHYEPTLTSDLRLLDDAYALNVRAPYRAAQLLGAAMAERGRGAIVNVSSPSARLPGSPLDGGQRPPWSALAYGISKAALDRFSQGLAQELFERNVAVVTVYPGFTRTELLEAAPPAGLDIERAEPASHIAQAIVRICTSPMSYTGKGLTWRDVMEA